MTSVKSEDCALLVFQSSPAEFGLVTCENCRRPIWVQLEMIMKDRIYGDSRSEEDKLELKAEFKKVEDSNEDDAKRKKLTILLSWLNKWEGHNSLMRCPNCQKILVSNF